MSEKRHVVRDDDGWAVRKPGAERVSSRHEKHDDALARAREIVANAGGGSVVVHGDDGQIERVAKVEPGERNDGSTPRRDENGQFVAESERSDGGSGSTPRRDENGQFVAETDRSDGGSDSTPRRDENGQFVAESDARDGDSDSTPRRDEDGQFVAASDASDGGSDSTPPRDDDGQFVAEAGDSKTLRDTAASILGKRAGTDGGGSVLPESLDTKVVVDKVGKGARTLAGALGTAGKIGAGAAVVAASAAVEKKRELSEAAKIERERRATREATAERSADARSDDEGSVTSPDTARDADGGEVTASAGGGLPGSADEHRPGGTAGRSDRPGDRVADGMQERPGVTAEESAPYPTRTESTERVVETSGIDDESDRHGVEPYGQDGGQDGPALEHPAAAAENVAERGSRSGLSDRAGLDSSGGGVTGTRSPSSPGEIPDSAGDVPMPERRSRLLGSLFDRARRYLGADVDRPRSERDPSRHDVARRDDRRDGGGDV